jgi:hypothetical protein
MEYMILAALLVAWMLFKNSRPATQKIWTPKEPEAIFHEERRGGPTPIDQEKQAVCKAARDEWLAAHDAIAAGSTKRGDVYLCHGERN